MAKANGLDAVRRIGGTRLKHLNARLREHGEPALFEAIAKLGMSDWHCGRQDGSVWRADFNWLFGSPRHFEKILERSSDPQPGSTRTYSEEEKRCIALSGADLYERMGRHEEAAAIRRRWGVPPPSPAPADLLQACGTSQSEGAERAAAH
jgi:hypothetical protein